MPRKGKGGSRGRGSPRVNIQIHIKLPRKVKGRAVVYTPKFVEGVIQNWLDTGELPVFCSLEYVDWEIEENGRPRSGRIGGQEAEQWREGFLKRFRYGIAAAPVQDMGQSEDDVEA